VADPSAPTVVRESAYDSTLVTARQHGDVVRLVVSTGLPDLDFAQPGLFRREGTALEKNQGVVRSSTIDDWLPHVTTTGPDGTEREQLVGCDDVAIPSSDAGLGTVAVVGFDVHDPATTDTTAVTTPSETVYVSGEHLYLASSAYRSGWQVCCWDVPQTEPKTVSDDGTTYLYGFDLAGTATTYAASGQVDGSTAGPWTSTTACCGSRSGRPCGPGASARSSRSRRKAATWSRPAASTGSASARRSSPCGGSTTSRWS
jgi:hypothetical protein